MSFRKKAAYRVVLLVASVDETLTCDHSFNLDLFIMLYKEILRTDNNFIIFLGGGESVRVLFPYVQDISLFRFIVYNIIFLLQKVYGIFWYLPSPHQKYKGLSLTFKTVNTPILRFI